MKNNRSASCSYEPHRLSAICLSDAYEKLVQTSKRSINISKKEKNLKTKKEMRGGMQC